MGIYVYCIKEDYLYKSAITGRQFENEWVRLDADGTITVKGSHGNGYAWDGCSPKWKFKGMYFGTPEGILDTTTQKSKTYYASLIHDLLYQFSKEVAGSIKRREIDREFYNIMKRDGFGMAFWYYGAVRLFGGMWWAQPKIVKLILGRPG